MKDDASFDMPPTLDTANLAKVQAVERFLLDPAAAGAETLPPQLDSVSPRSATTGDSSGARHPEVDGYDIIAELGRGGMGVVYQARQRSLNRLVALKMILAGDHAGSHERERFRIEAEAAAHLQHPHIAQVYEIGHAGGRPFLCLEFCPGGSLDKKLNGTPLRAPGGRTTRRDAGLRDGCCPPGRDYSPRPQAGQHPVNGRRESQDHGLRPRQEGRRGRGADGERSGPRHSQLHVARAGQR